MKLKRYLEIIKKEFTPKFIIEVVALIILIVGLIITLVFITNNIIKNNKEDSNEEKIETENINQESTNNTQIKLVEINYDNEFIYYYDIDTLVIYVRSNRVGMPMTVLLNADGTPRLYK